MLQNYIIPTGHAKKNSYSGRGFSLFFICIHYISHYIRGRALLEQEFFHAVHIRCYMAEEMAVALTQIVEPRLSIPREGKTVARTFAMTGKEIGAFSALGGQCLTLGPAEGLLPRAVHHLHKRVVPDIAQTIGGKHKMVAGIHVTIGFEHPCMSAFGSQRTKPGCHAHPIGQRTVEHLHKHLSHVVPYPFVEHAA